MINNSYKFSYLSSINTNMNKSINKLSTGVKINSAPDDAAGLGISEGMRSQIRGLNQAESNIQDGVSLIQVADGALQETQNIIHRMRELSVQAVNETNTLEDKESIQKELNQLILAIDDIAENTGFNNIKILKGSEYKIHRLTFLICGRCQSYYKYKYIWSYLC